MKTITTFGVVSLLMLGLVSTSYASIDKNLKYGQRDKEVAELQEFLIDGGFLNGTPTTFFGLLTLRAVKTYQKSVNISPTGYVGVLTRQKINETIASELASSNEAERSETGTTTTTSPTTQNTSVIQGCLPGHSFNSLTGKPCLAASVSSVDFCKNIEGIQTKVPEGMTLNSTGNCSSVNSNVSTETKVCLSGKVVSKNDDCTKTCSDGEIVLENLTCRTITSTNTNTNTQTSNQNNTSQQQSTIGQTVNTPTGPTKPLTAVSTFHINEPNHLQIKFMNSWNRNDCQNNQPINCFPIFTSSTFLPNSTDHSQWVTYGQLIDSLSINFQSTTDTLTEENYQAYAYSMGEEVIVKSFKAKIITDLSDQDISDIKFIVYGGSGWLREAPVIREGNTFIYKDGSVVIPRGGQGGISFYAKLTPSALDKNLQVIFTDLVLIGKTTNLPIPVTFSLPQEGRNSNLNFIVTRN